MEKQFEYDHHKKDHASRLIELPFDMITEILSWLPVNSLLRFKCVCKKWHSLIEELYVISIHMRRSTPLFLPYEANSILDEKFRIIDSFSGLLLKQNITTHKYHISNPATRQVLKLPNPNHGNQLFQRLSAFNSCTHECKLLFAYNFNKRGVEQTVSEILSVGIDDHWRPLRPQFQREPGKVIRKFFLRNEGLIHFVKVARNQRHFDLKVFSFNVWKETSVVNALPRGVFTNLSKTFLFLWDNCIAVSEITEEALLVMVLKKYQEGFRWNKRRILLRFLREKTYSKETLVPLVAKSSNVWFHFEEKMFCYDTNTEIIKETRVLIPEEKNNRTYKYRPGLVKLKGMKAEGT